MKIILDGVLEKLSTLADGTVKVQFSTNELDPSKGGELFQLRGKYCKALFSDTNISSLEEEMVDSTKIAAVKKNKSHSQRLRAVLYVAHEQSGLDIDFESFYSTELEKIISHYKNKLE